MKVKDIAKLYNAEAFGDLNSEVITVDELCGKKSSALGFIGEEQYLKQLSGSTAKVLLVENNLNNKLLDEWLAIEAGRAYIKIKNAYRVFIKLTYKLLSKDELEIQTPVEQRKEYPGVYFGKNVIIGKDVKLFPGVVVMDDCTIGDSSIIYPNVTVYKNTRIGKRAIIGSGTVLGSDGFGFVKDEDGSLLKVPHLGGLVIEDDVEIGSNTSVDRGTLGDTLIRKGTKIDNLVQVAHNCILGENNILCGMVGLSGSTELGNNVIMGANSGTKGHIKIGDNCIVTARTSVSKVLKSGSEVKGIYPARPIAEELKIQTLVGKLPELYERIKKLEKGEK
jgi:UDP-3-O-[3-hydroxymyristoyl] glucosamine N-acyltransferase